MSPNSHSRILGFASLCHCSKWAQERKADLWLQNLRGEWVWVCVSSNCSVLEGFSFSLVFAYLQLWLQSSSNSCCRGISGKRENSESLGQQGFICSVNHRACANVRMSFGLNMTLREFCFSLVSKAPYYEDKERGRNRTLYSNSPLKIFFPFV